MKKMLEVGKFVRGNDGSRNWIGQIVEVDQLTSEYRVRNVNSALYSYVSADEVKQCARPLSACF